MKEELERVAREALPGGGQRLRIAARVLALGIVAACGSAAAQVDLASLWDFSKPDVSEQRFTAALAAANPDDAFVLRTQIARTWGLRKDFDKARAVLKEIEPQLASTSAQGQVRYWLELGRTHVSATHPPAALTPEAKAQARAAYGQALELARSAQLDALAIDTIHMYAFIDTAPRDQVKWNLAALAIVEQSKQPAAKRWEASVRNNLGYALHQSGQYPEALAEFQRALKLREQAGNAKSIRVAKWMIAWTLRAMKRHDEALEMQLALEREGEAAREPDPHVFEELEHLYRARGDEDRAAHYARKRKT